MSVNRLYLRYLITLLTTFLLLSIGVESNGEPIIGIKNNTPILISQSSQQLDGHWQRQDTEGFVTDLILYNSESYIYIITSTKNKHWFANTGTWINDNGELILKNKNGSIFSQVNLNLKSNNQLILSGESYQRVNEQSSAFNQHLTGTWKVDSQSKLILPGSSKILIEFQPGGKYRYQRINLYASPGVIDPGELVTDRWGWFVTSPKYLSIDNTLGICRIYWNSRDEFVCINPSKGKNIGAVYTFRRTNERF